MPNRTRFTNLPMLSGRLAMSLCWRSNWVSSTHSPNSEIEIRDYLKLRRLEKNIYRLKKVGYHWEYSLDGCNWVDRQWEIERDDQWKKEVHGSYSLWMNDQVMDKGVYHTNLRSSIFTFCRSPIDSPTDTILKSHLLLYLIEPFFVRWFFILILVREDKMTKVPVVSQPKSFHWWQLVDYRRNL